MDENTETFPHYITTAEAARRLDIGAPMIRQLLGTEIEGARFGRVFKVDADSLEAYRQRQTIRPSNRHPAVDLPAQYEGPRVPTTYDPAAEWA